MSSSPIRNKMSIPVCTIVDCIPFLHADKLVTIFVTDVTELQLLFIWSSKDPKMFKDSVGSVFPRLPFVVWKGGLICNRYKSICHFAALPKINESIKDYISEHLLIMRGGLLIRNCIRTRTTHVVAFHRNITKSHIAAKPNSALPVSKETQPVFCSS